MSHGLPYCPPASPFPPLSVSLSPPPPPSLLHSTLSFLHWPARRVWKTYFPAVHAIVFMVDASDRERFKESKAELDVRTKLERMRGRDPVYVCVCVCQSTSPSSQPHKMKQIRRVRPCPSPASPSLLSPFLILFIFSAPLPNHQALLADEAIANIPIVVLGNKIDIPGAASEEELRAALGLIGQTTGKGTVPKTSLASRPLELFMCTVIKKQGYGDGFRWLSQYL